MSKILSQSEPTAELNSGNSNNAPESSDLAAVLKNSRDSVAASPVVSIKRKRGRPKKGEPAQNKVVSGNLAPETEQLPAMPTIPSEVLKPIIEMPFKIAARRTKFAEFALTPEESSELAPLFGTVLQQYMPATAGPHSPVMVLAGSIAMLALAKFMMYQDAIASQPTQTPDQAAASAAPGVFPTIVA